MGNENGTQTYHIYLNIFLDIKSSSRSIKYIVSEKHDMFPINYDAAYLADLIFLFP